MCFRYVLGIATISSLSVFLASCAIDADRSNDRSSSEGLSKLNKELCVFEESALSKIKELGLKIEALGRKVDGVDKKRSKDALEFVKQSDFLDLLRRVINPHAVLNLKGKDGYSKLNSDGFVFCISVDDVQPYLDGFKVFLKIGNPMFATFHNPKISVKWGRGYLKYATEKRSEGCNDSNILNLWSASLKEKETSILKELKPGVWNKVEIVLTPATLDEIEYVAVSIEMDTISFYNDTSTQ